MQVKKIWFEHVNMISAVQSPNSNEIFFCKRWKKSINMERNQSANDLIRRHEYVIHWIWYHVELDCFRKLWILHLELTKVSDAKISGQNKNFVYIILLEMREINIWLEHDVNMLSAVQSPNFNEIFWGGKWIKRILLEII